MKKVLVLIFFFSISIVNAQVLNSNQHKALNAYIEFIDHSVNQVHSDMNILKGLFDDAQYFRTKKLDNIRTSSRFPEIDEHYFTNATTLGKQLGTEGQLIQKRADELNKLLKKINITCKELEVYFRLEDYKSDSMLFADKVMKELQILSVDFRNEKEAFYAQLFKSYRKFQPYNAANPYHKAEKEMLAVIKSDADLLKSWNFNFNDKVSSGWPIDKVQENITANSKVVEYFKNPPSTIKYPESSSYLSFGRAIEASLSNKSSKVDNYNFEAKKSDRYPNQVYSEFINNFNNDLVYSYNDFVNYSVGNGQRFLMYPKFSPVFVINEKSENIVNEVKPFKDIPSETLTTTKRAERISYDVSTALNNYVEFINESLNQLKYLQLMLRNYNSSANYHKVSASAYKGNVSYTHENFKIPQTDYYKALNGSKNLPSQYQKPLNDQHEVLMNILKEIDGLGIELEEYTQDKKYKEDDFSRSEEILKRIHELITLVNNKKEKLYEDVHQVYYSYGQDDENKSWFISSQALARNIDLSKKYLFQSRDYLGTKINEIPKADELKEKSRILVINEYSNMQGIKRLGRSNGLCPYTPYENIAEQSVSFADKLAGLQRASPGENERVYDGFVYIYNNLVDDYNKFADLAPIKTLRNIRQINVLDFPPAEKTPELARNNPPKKKEDKPLNKPEAVAEARATETPVRRDTVTVVKEVRTEVVKRDTVFVETARVDTVYINAGIDKEEFLSLEGYATNNIILLLDVSSSMNAPHKLPLLKKSVKLLMQMYRPEDQISIVLYSGKAKVALDPTSGSDKEKIEDVIDKLKSGGGTDANAGLRLAYKVADNNYKRGGNNRVILATDGEFKLSGSSMKMVEANANDDIFLTVFNYTNKTQVSESLKKLSELGKGNYENITPENADAKMVREAKAKRR